MSFNDLGLSAELLRAVEEKGYTQPTPIQQKAIPAVLSGRDLLASAQTGTGKTASFTLPLLQRLSETLPQTETAGTAQRDRSTENGGRPKPILRHQRGGSGSRGGRL